MATNPKRKLDEADPDYVTLEDQEAKRHKALEENGRQNACKKIQAIIQGEFQAEISSKERELQQVDIRLNEARLTLDRLRACVVANYYGLAGRSAQVAKDLHGSSDKSEVQSIHPAVKKFIIGKAPKNKSTPLEEADTSHSNTQSLAADVKQEVQTDEENAKNKMIAKRAHASLVAKTSLQTSRSNSPSLNANPTFDDRRGRLKVKRRIIVGNVSKYIPVDQRESNDMSSHKWMIYVRGPKSDPDISYFVKRVWFFLHHSYKPNDLVEISNSPFHLTRRGWGEFPVRVQLHFWDSRNKKVDIFHHLKLDKTFTGLQKLGGETVVEVELERDIFEDTKAGPEKNVSLSSIPRSRSSVSSSLSSSSLQKASDKLIESDREENLITSAMLTENEIKKEINSEDFGRLHDDSESSSKEIQRQQQHIQQPFPIKKELGMSTHDDDVLAKKNAMVKLHSSNSDLLANPDNGAEYNVTITHSSNEARQNRNEDMEVDVCDSESVLVSGSVGNCTMQTGSKVASKQSLGSSGSLRLKQMRTNGLSGLLAQSLIDDHGKPVPSHDSILPRLSSEQISLAVTPVTLHDSSKAMPSSSSPVPPQATTYSPVNHREILGRSNVQQTLTASCSVSSKVEGAPSQTLGLNQQGKQKAGAGACGVMNIPSTSLTSFLKSTNAQQLKVINFPNMLTANAPQRGPMAQASLIKTVPNTQSLKTKYSLVRNGTINHVHVGGAQVMDLNQGGMSQQITSSPTQNVDIRKNNSVLMHVKPNPSQHKFVFVKPNTIVSAPQPTISKAVSLPTPSQNTKKQVSLLTGLVINSSTSKPIHSSHANSLLKPGTFKIVEGPASANVAAQNRISNSVPQKNQISMRLAGQPYVPKIISNVNASSNSDALIVAGKPYVTKVLSNARDMLKIMVNPSSANVMSNQTALKDTLSITDRKHYATNNIVLNQTAHIDDGLDRDLHNMSAIGITKYKRSLQSQSYSQVVMKERKYMAVPTTVRKSFDCIEGDAEDIQPLNLEDFPDARCLMKAAIKLHPLIQANVNKLTHPYCAVSARQWASWPVGKQRASEWHRACFVLKYIKACLGGMTQFKGEKLMSTRQLVHWCRLHAFSPQSPIFRHTVKHDQEQQHQHEQQQQQHTMSPSAQSSNEETHQILLSAMPTVTSVTKLKDAMAELQKMEHSIADNEEPERIHVDVDDNGVREEKPGVSNKEEILEIDKDMSRTELIPPSEGASFVSDWMRQRGIKFSPNQLEPGVVTNTAEDMIYHAMMEFGADILRKAFCVSKEQQGSSSSSISPRDVHNSLVALPEASFCCNRFLGKEDEEEEEEKDADRSTGEKEIYR